MRIFAGIFKIISLLIMNVHLKYIYDVESIDFGLCWFN